MNGIENGAYSKRFNEQLAKYEKEEDAIQEEIDNAYKRKDSELKINDILRFFRFYACELDDAEKRKKILELLVDRIYIYDEEVVVTFFFCDDRRRLNIKETTTMIANQKRMMDFVDPNYVSKVRTRIPITYLTIDNKVLDLIFFTSGSTRRKSSP